MYKASYEKIKDLDGKELPDIPVVNLYLQNPVNEYLSTVFNYCILDTGSDGTIVPLEIIRDRLLIIPSDSQERTILNGVGGEKINAPVYRIKISFDGEIFVNIKAVVLANNTSRNEIIIGRDVLNRYEINFNGPESIFTISD
jgi:Aspartyl protease